MVSIRRLGGTADAETGPPQATRENGRFRRSFVRKDSTLRILHGRGLRHRHRACRTAGSLPDGQFETWTRGRLPLSQRVTCQMPQTPGQPSISFLSSASIHSGRLTICGCNNSQSTRSPAEGSRSDTADGSQSAVSRRWQLQHELFCYTGSSTVYPSVVSSELLMSNHAFGSC